MRLQLPPNRKIVKPIGPLNPDIAIVGEQPGRTEMVKGIPFSGPAGMVLDKCLKGADINRSDCYITNVVKDFDHPIEYYIDLSDKKTKVSEEGNLYIQYLRQELLEVKPKIIVALGNIALYALREHKGVTKWAGSIMDSIIGIPIIPTLHPATVIPPKCIYLNELLIKFDLTRAKLFSKLGNDIFDKITPIIEPSFYQSVDFLEKCIEEGKKGKPISFDIEVVNEKLSCISFSYLPGEALSIPFIGPGGDYFNPDQELEIMKLIAIILQDKEITKRGQNIVFDTTYMLNEYGIVVDGPIEDTMIAQKISCPDYPAGLDFITRIHTVIPYYKDEGKKYLTVGGSFQSFWVYNAMDSIICSLVHDRQMIDLIRQGNVETYNRQKAIIPALVFMSTKGIRVDVEGMIKEREISNKKIEEKKKELNELVGYEINHSSPKQLVDYFYNVKGIKPYVNRKTKKISTDEDALKRIARKGHKEAEIILELRGLSKRVGTYLNILKVDSDGRMHSAYNPVGTRTGRLSSSENIFGTGTNQQNWPHDLLQYLLPDEGNIFYSFDLSQIENRIVAYVSRCTPMIEAFENGFDLHRLTAALIFGKDPEKISDEEGSSPLGGGKYSERYWGKRANHGLNYDLSYKSFALYYEIPEKEAKFIVDRYHKAYPEVRSNYHTMIKNQLALDRSVTNLMGRKRVFLDQWGDSLFKEAYAQLPQSTVADVMNERGITYIYNNFPDVALLNQIHDSVGFQISLSLPWLEHARILNEIRKSLETPLITKNLTMPVLADLTIGISLFKGQFGKRLKELGKSVEIKSAKFPSDLETLASKLEATYNTLMMLKHE